MYNSLALEPWQKYFPNEPSRKNFVKYIGRIKLLLDFFDDKLTKGEVKVELKVRVVITGSLQSGSRNKWIENHPLAEVGENINSEIDYLITNENKNTVKLKTAEKLRIKIINESEFEVVYKNYEC